ncbi:PREDICTED: SH2 domain-containing protein 2A [Nipponia nippon]|uniref:SH2 domain-containing protein 2A n=1 Tax=Nipponia nippon TaxID=128390 RepID=UPI0005119E5C|nr:PREDICTED: SH2 domain-containing protein 2A [Nipponia nippon]
MDDDRPLFSTFKPISEDNMASAKPGPNTTPVQPQGAEQRPGHQDTEGRVPPGSWLSPPGWSPLEGDPRPELVALRARTRLWFEQTQAKRLEVKGELPAWFHGFISRRETEQLLQDQPPGCFLVRFSESTVGFVLSYRGRDRCRHFVLDQLPDGRYVILGERSAHTELADLLRHYTAAPVTPYHEFLTVPRGRPKKRRPPPELAALLRHYTAAPVTPYHEFLTVPRGREDEAQGGTRTPASGDAARSPSSEAPAKLPAYGTVTKGPLGARQVAAAPPLPTEPSAKAPSVPPPLPAKASSSAVAQGSHSPAGGRAAPEDPYAQVRQEAVPAAPPVPPQPADAKYQQLMCFHTYAEPHEGIAPRASTYCELEEPIPFYAVGRGSSPSAGPEENIYSEVALARQDLPAPLPRGAPGAFSTLPPKSRAHHRLFRSISSQASKRRQLPVAPTGDGKERGGCGPAAELSLRIAQNPPLEFNDPLYGGRTSTAKRAAATRAGPENIYEQLSGDHP